MSTFTFIFIFVIKLKSIIQRILNESLTILDEMPNITTKGKSAFANDVPLKNIKIDDIKGNIAFIRQQKKGGFVSFGWTVVYFMDNEESADLMRQGKIPLLVIPVGTFMSGGSPITDVWKKKFQRPGHEHILGLIQAHTDDTDIYLDMVSVRPGYKRNSIASKMIEVLKHRFPNAKISHSAPTDNGRAFLKAKNYLEPKYKDMMGSS